MKKINKDVLRNLVQFDMEMPKSIFVAEFSTSKARETESKRWEGKQVKQLLMPLTRKNFTEDEDWVTEKLRSHERLLQLAQAKNTEID